MRKKSIFYQYFSTGALLVMICLIIVGVTMLVVASRHFKVEKYEQLTNSMERIHREINGDSFTSTHQNLVCEMVAESINGSVVQISDTGSVVFSYSVDDAVNTSCQMDAEHLTAIATSHNASGTLDGLFRDNQFYVSMAEYANGEPFCYFIVAASVQSRGQYLSNLFWIFLCSAVIAVLLAVLLSGFISFKMAKPLTDLSDAANHYSRGDFAQSLDITRQDEIGMLAQSLNEMAASLSSMEYMRSNFIANVSHELKTPMTTISGFIDGILDGTIGPHQQRHYLEIVSTEVKRLSRLVRSMLNIAKIESGKMTLTRTKFDIVETVRTSLFAMEQAINAKNINISGIDADKVIIEADKDLIHQVIYNLIDNAVKFTNDNGLISFTFDEMPDYITVSIRNTGEGLTKEEIHKIFDRFYKTDTSRAQDKNGVGLGLYIVRTFLNLHGGTIDVRSVKGSFCEFIITLPTGKNHWKLKNS